jgi:hypothetical protein
MYETYQSHSTGSLLKLAEEFRTLVGAMNGSACIDYGRVAIRNPDSAVMVSADKDGVRFNFASAAIARIIMGEIEDMQTVADEVRIRLKTLPHPGMYEHMLLDMERESRKCLDLQFGTPYPTAAHIMGYSHR